jgi:hypothetical protein
MIYSGNPCLKSACSLRMASNSPANWFSLYNNVQCTILMADHTPCVFSHSQWRLEYCSAHSMAIYRLHAYLHRRHELVGATGRCRTGNPDHLNRSKRLLLTISCLPPHSNGSFILAIREVLVSHSDSISVMYSLLLSINRESS